MPSKNSVQRTDSPAPLAPAHMLDMQQRELMGRHRLIEALVREHIEVAMPLRDSGVDLIAYTQVAPSDAPSTQVPTFVSVPIQMKSATQERFSVHKKYEAIAGLLLVYVWHVDDSTKLAFYAMTYEQSVAIAHARGMTKTNSWNTPKGKYSATSISAPLRAALAPYLVKSPRSWRTVLLEASRQTPKR